MSTNEFIPVVFNDGEPLDPTKLNNLVKNVNNVYQSASLANASVSGSTVLQTPVIFTYRHRFENVKAGVAPQTHSFTFGGKFTNEELTQKKVFVATGITSGVGDNDNVNVQIGDIQTGSPKIYVSMQGTGARPVVNVDVIAICMRDIV